MIEMLENYFNNGYRLETMDIDNEEENTVDINIVLIKREWDY